MMLKSHNTRTNNKIVKLRCYVARVVLHSLHLLNSLILFSIWTFFRPFDSWHESKYSEIKTFWRIEQNLQSNRCYHMRIADGKLTKKKKWSACPFIFLGNHHTTHQKRKSKNKKKFKWKLWTVTHRTDCMTNERINRNETEVSGLNAYYIITIIIISRVEPKRTKKKWANCPESKFRMTRDKRNESWSRTREEQQQ